MSNKKYLNNPTHMLFLILELAKGKNWMSIFRLNQSYLIKTTTKNL
jgi:hypothetical protein